MRTERFFTNIIVPTSLTLEPIPALFSPHKELLNELLNISVPALLQNLTFAAYMTCVQVVRRVRTDRFSVVYFYLMFQFLHRYLYCSRLTTSFPMSY